MPCSFFFERFARFSSSYIIFYNGTVVCINFPQGTGSPFYFYRSQFSLFYGLYASYLTH